jgi:hypothetical protein
MFKNVSVKCPLCYVVRVRNIGSIAIDHLLLNAFQNIEQRNDVVQPT